MITVDVRMTIIANLLNFFSCKSASKIEPSNSPQIISDNLERIKKKKM